MFGRVEHDDAALVRQVVLRFQSNMADTFEGAVESLTGRKVLTHQSQVLFDPDYTVEIFVLGDKGTAPDTKE